MVLACASFKGGVGKSTLAQNVAVVFSRLGYKVAIVDVDESLVTQQWAKLRDKNEQKPSIEVIAENRQDHIIDVIRELYYNQGYDVVIIDCPPSYQPILTQIMLVSTTVLIPVMPTGRSEILTVRDFIERYISIVNEKEEPTPAYLVVNKFEANVNLHKAVLRVLVNLPNDFDVKLINTILYKRTAYGEANLYGLGVFEHDNPKARKEITGLVKELIEAEFKEK